MAYLAKCAVVYQPDGAPAPIEAAPGSLISDLPEEIAPMLIERGSIEAADFEPTAEADESAAPAKSARKGAKGKQPVEAQPAAPANDEPQQPAAPANDDLI